MAHNFGNFSLKLGTRMCVDEEGKPVEVTIMARLRGTGAIVDGGREDYDEDCGAEVVCERKEATSG